MKRRKMEKLGKDSRRKAEQGRKWEKREGEMIRKRNNMLQQKENSAD